MKTITTIILFISTLNTVYSQLLISDENTSRAVDSNAILELSTNSASKGLLLPYVNLTSVTNATPLPSHISGMIVYNINTSINDDVNTSVFPGLYHNDGTAWQKLEVETPAFGDIKYSATSNDHDGWYLLNGRLINTLSTNASQKATALGFTSNLPNANDHFLKYKSTTENLGQVVGANTVQLTQSNLPNITLNGTTNSSTHSHGYNERGTGVLVSIEVGSTRNLIDDNNQIRTTGAAGGHTHTYTVNSGGSNTPIATQPKYLGAYIFIYLGN